MLLGVLPVLPTPFGPSGAVDAPAMAGIVDFVLRCGAHGVVYPGVASEVQHLSPEERRALVANVGARLAGRVPFLVGASAATVDEVAAMAENGRANGAAAAMVMAPAALGSRPDVLIDFFRGVSAASPVALVLQNAPPPVGAGLPVEVIREVAAAVPAIRYVKEETLPSGPRISALLDGAPDHLAGVIGGGGARYVFDELERGAVALMPAAEITDLHVALYEAFAGQDRPRARVLYVRSLPILLVQAVFRMRLTKEALRRRGVLKEAGVRAPLPDFDERGLAEVEAMLAELADVLQPPQGARERIA